jgi:dihydrolipoamide dehydrogenase
LQVSDVISTNVLVIGAGPGGYVAALRAGQLGLGTVIVDADGLGGACLNRGCIPSKALIHAAETYAAMTRAASGAGTMGIRLAAPPSLDFAETIRWKDGIVRRLSTGVAGLLKRARVRHIAGRAVFSDAKTCTVETGGQTLTIRAQNVILATGARPAELPHLPFGGDVISSTEALSLAHPPKRLVVVGAGYIGLELGQAFAKLGSQVTIVEAQDRILPGFDAELAQPVLKTLGRDGIGLHLSAKAMAVTDQGLTIETAEGARQTLPADKILVTVGRRPVTDGFGLDAMGVDLKDGFIAVDAQLKTSMRGVYAIGDVTGEPMLAHRASAQGELVADVIAGKTRVFDPVAIPAVCFTDPEIVSVGLTLPQAKDKGYRAQDAQFPFQANGRALTLGESDGFVRIVFARDDGRVLGVQAVGARVIELSGEFTLALEMGAVLEDIAGVIHAHPTLGEAFLESALKALSGA